MLPSTRVDRPAPSRRRRGGPVGDLLSAAPFCVAIAPVLALPAVLEPDLKHLLTRILP